MDGLRVHDGEALRHSGLALLRLDPAGGNLEGRLPGVLARNGDRSALPGAKENLKTFKTRYKKIDIVPISAETGEGIEAVKTTLARWIAK